MAWQGGSGVNCFAIVPFCPCWSLFLFGVNTRSSVCVCVCVCMCVFRHWLVASTGTFAWRLTRRGEEGKKAERWASRDCRMMCDYVAGIRLGAVSSPRLEAVQSRARRSSTSSGRIITPAQSTRSARRLVVSAQENSARFLLLLFFFFPPSSPPSPVRGGAGLPVSRILASREDGNQNMSAFFPDP